MKQTLSRQFISRCFLMMLASLAATPSMASAGWYFLATTTSPQGASTVTRPAQLVTAISRNRIKYTTNVWTLIVNLDSQQLVLANHIRKRSWTGPLDEYFAILAQQLHDSQQKADKMLQTMPLEQSQRLRAFSRVDPFDPLLPSLTITVTPTSEQTPIATHPTQKYEVRRNDEVYEETWIATDLLVTADLDEKKHKALVDKLQRTRTTPPGAVLAELTDLVTKGYPLKTTNVVSQVTKEVVQVQQQEFPDEDFVAPAGYTLSPLPETMSLR